MVETAGIGLIGPVAEKAALDARAIKTVLCVTRYHVLFVMHPGTKND